VVTGLLQLPCVVLLWSEMNEIGGLCKLSLINVVKIFSVSHCRVVALGKLLTHVSLCHQGPMMLFGWEGTAVTCAESNGSLPLGL